MHAIKFMNECDLNPRAPNSNNYIYIYHVCCSSFDSVVCRPSISAFSLLELSGDNTQVFLRSVLNGCHTNASR